MFCMIAVVLVFSVGHMKTKQSNFMDLLERVSYPELLGVFNTQIKIVDSFHTHFFSIVIVIGILTPNTTLIVP